MSVYQEIIQATNFEAPDSYEQSDWVSLVRACATLDDEVWDALSADAQKWLNASIRQVKAKVDVTPLEIPEPKAARERIPLDEPEEPEVFSDESPESEEPKESEEPEAAQEPVEEVRAPKKKAAKKKRASKKKVEESATVATGEKPADGGVVGKRKKRTPSFRQGSCYRFVRWLVEQDLSYGEINVEDLPKMIEGTGIDLSPKSLTVMYYNALNVMRGLRDMDMFDHKLVSDIPKQD